MNSFSLGGKLDTFINEVEILAQKYGYPHFFIAYAEPIDGQKCEWNARSNMISEGMADYLENCAYYLRESLHGNY